MIGMVDNVGCIEGQIWVISLQNNHFSCCSITLAPKLVLLFYLSPHPLTNTRIMEHITNKVQQTSREGK